jgi:hypothetical protein
MVRVDCRLARKGRLYERSQHIFRSADPAALDPAAALDAHDETTGGSVWLSKDVSALWVNHISIQEMLPGVWQAFYSGRIFDFAQMR